MAAIKAGRNKAFISMDGGLLSGFGPRLGLALAELNAAFRALAPAS
jgi:iron complex transport system substrate-binding protein